ncbi:MAG: D-lysine 5,6-aminomutase subunit alpha [Bdellovibrionales bacterium]|jgi:beta-lysine 5,6-aminomutase alpha subunit|nr:D-lysine 5,6-aminomutase subunit alpha [Bdellovibrionales bacterium]MBT3526590.1 D-lysine 5,6-aminomutase subunit alpha [Bdellovibrionales bacterium]MBT7670155.1 D-lysine 5,6-aminomutase subunit alpha [Bdellovibrionales bacterium]MBT7768231.1 D-lysine 5,6-aminomutase subunit alpha [Bdellovibrionales bacterium]
MTKLNLDTKQIERVRLLASKISDPIELMIEQHSTFSVERSLLRLYGVDGVCDGDFPIVNRLIEKLSECGAINDGISPHFAAAMIKSGRDVMTTVKMLLAGSIAFDSKSDINSPEVIEMEARLTMTAMQRLDRCRINREKKRQELPAPITPLRYLIVATGNIYEDRTQAKAAAQEGADLIAVIRSTAQSLLDYVPHGATTEGFGGTYATQENFKIMRQALDSASDQQQRYIGLVNYSSGLCMPEIAACAAMEELDMLLNDSMYGILFRDINMKRTFVDQHMSRLICSRTGIIINTGEDNYLTTADAIESAHTVTTSQLINQAMGKAALLEDDQLGLGHAFEINPSIEGGFLRELAHALLARELFPHAPLKYMPPTKHKSSDIFFSHAMDTMFNLASITTGQGIHLAGMPTEAIHTPFMQDRYQALSSINYVFNSCRGLEDELEYKKGGKITTFACEVLDKTEQLLMDIVDEGLMAAISKGRFADIKRGEMDGKGADGLFAKSNRYRNPIMNTIKDKLPSLAL